MCSGKDVMKVAGVAAAVYTGGASMGLWGAAEGAVAAGATEIGAGAIASGAGDAMVATTAAGEAAGATAATGGTMATALKYAPLVSGAASIAGLAMGQQPQMGAQGVASPSGPPASQAALTPTANVFKKKLAGLGDPTMLTGPGGVDSGSLTLGKSTILGA